VYLLPEDILSAFAYWVTSQNPNKELINITPALTAYRKHTLLAFPNPKMPEEFNWNSLKALVNSDLFEEIPEILALNELKPDFIDLGALARNVFYMVLREQITQSSYLIGNQDEKVISQDQVSV